jgi:hypothetical protein
MNTPIHMLIAVTLLGVASVASAQEIVLGTGKVEGAPGKEVEVPISVKGAKGKKGDKSVTCMSFQLSYDPKVLTFKAVKEGPILPNAMLGKSIDEKDPGKLGLSLTCGSKSPGSKEMASIAQDGTIILVSFLVNEKASPGQKSPLTIGKNAQAFDNEEPPHELLVRPEEGEFAVAGAGLPLNWLYVGIAAAVLLLLILLIVLATRRKAPARR